MKLVIRGLIVFSVMCGSLFAQEKFQVFPQIADGVLADGTYYKSTLMILPWFESDAATCNLSLYGVSVNLNGPGNPLSSNLNITVPSGGYFTAITGAEQALHSGYATLTCSEYVYANVLYTLYGSNGFKIAEATVFGTSESFWYARMIFDQSGGEQLGLAIANNTDIPHTYRITVGTRSTTVSIPARRSLARFVGELITGLPAKGILKIEAIDYSSFSAVGLRFTGGIFTTIPAN
jgi:hypothetical protein